MNHLRLPSLSRRALALIAVVTPILVLFIYVALRSGPLAPVTVVIQNVEKSAISPSLFGIGTVEARYTYQIGPTFSGRIRTLHVHVGDTVQAGQELGEIDPVDLDERLHSQISTQKRVVAQIAEAQARASYTQAQAKRYEKLWQSHVASEEIFTTKQQENLMAQAALRAMQEELARVRADYEALSAQRQNLKLIAPVAGLITARNADPGTTLIAGQAALEMIDPRSVWINARFDQLDAYGLAANLPAQITLRSQRDQSRNGFVLRVEPIADAVTEERLAKIGFDPLPDPLPPIGELSEVTISLATLPEAPVIPNAAIQQSNGKIGVWKVEDGDLHFVPVELGATDLHGKVQVKTGLSVGDSIVVYSEKTLRATSRIRVAKTLPGTKS